MKRNWTSGIPTMTT